MRIPWVWMRRQLAHAWGIPPWEVDRAPNYEIILELELMAIEHEAREWRQARKR